MYWNLHIDPPVEKWILLLFTCNTCKYYVVHFKVLTFVFQLTNCFSPCNMLVYNVVQYTCYVLWLISVYGEVNTFRAAYTCTTVYLVQIFFYQRFYFSVIYTKKWYTHWQVCLCGCFRRAVILVFVILFLCMNLCLMVNVILIDWRCCFRLYFVKPSSANTVMLYNDNEWTVTYQWLFIPNQMI